MRIWHISDTHCHHDKLKVPEGIDLVIHSGDASNLKDPYANEHEMRSFITWFDGLKIPNKVFVAGNHDTSIERTLVHPEDIKALGIKYLHKETVEIMGLKIWGSPYVPRFGDWAFMKPRGKMMDKVWKFMDMDSDILVTHSPPKGILDLTGGYMQVSDNEKDRIRIMENVGCESLRKKVLELKPKLHCFGHIHGSNKIYNSGTLRPSGMNTIFSNGACCSHRREGSFFFNGNVIEL